MSQEYKALPVPSSYKDLLSRTRWRIPQQSWVSRSWPSGVLWSRSSACHRTTTTEVVASILVSQENIEHTRRHPNATRLPYVEAAMWSQNATLQNQKHSDTESQEPSLVGRDRHMGWQRAGQGPGRGEKVGGRGERGPGPGPEGPGG